MKTMSLPDLLLQAFVIVMCLWAAYNKWLAPHITSWFKRPNYRLLTNMLLNSEFSLLKRHGIVERRPELIPVPPPIAPQEVDDVEEETDDRPGYDTEDDDIPQTVEALAPAVAPVVVSVPARPVYLRPADPDPQVALQRAVEMWHAWMHKGMSSALHLIVIGQTGAGKTTVLQVFAADLVANGLPVVVCDPDAAAGDWPGTQVFGAGDDFKGIAQAFKAMQRMAQERRQARALGQREFPPFWLVLDEYADIKDECTLAGDVVENALRRWRKLNMHIVIGVQDTQVKTMGFERRSSLLNHARIVTLRLSGEGRRYAQIDDEASISIPQLTPPRGDVQEQLVALEKGEEVQPVGPLDILDGDTWEPTTSEDILAHVEDKDEQIRIMLAAGASYADIASRLKVATTRISRVKKDFMLET